MYKYTLRILSFIILNASILFADLQKNEFPHIQPISVEFADVSQKGYFSDSDNDGVADDKDKCAATLKNTKVDIFGCKLLLDDDHDGVSNREDKCPKSKENTTVDSTGCIPDSDKDGVGDLTDECPNTSRDFFVNTVGCPQTAIVKVHFEQGKASILPSTLIKVHEFGYFLQENKGYQAIIYGYTDDTGQNNQQLSRERARAVMNVLIEYGVKLTRLTAIGRGSKNPRADNETPQGRAKNRRVEVELLQ